MINTRRQFCVLNVGLLVCLLVNLPRAIADEPAATNEAPETIELTVSPASEASPALKHLLLPQYAERRPGNAAPFYLRAIVIRQSLGKIDEQYAQYEEQWLKWPLDDSAKKELEQWLEIQRVAIGEVTRAVSFDECDWGVRVRDLHGLDTISFPLHEIMQVRNLGRVMQMKAHLQIANGQLDEARQTIGQGYQLAADVADMPLLVSGLVGTTVSTMMTSELETFVQDPDAPNMYWAIASMPRPFIDLRTAMEQERSLAQQIFPVLKDIETAEYTEQQWQQHLARTVKDLTQLASDVVNVGDPLSEALLLARSALYYPSAKQQLIESGWSSERVEAMPIAQVLLLQSARATQYAFDETFKWTYLPLSEAQNHMAESEKRLIRDGYLGPPNVQNKSPLPIASILLPAIHNASYAPVRLQRRLAALQAVEAIRMYAASHAGMLPQTLDQITEVPVPVDPLTNAPLVYHLDGDAAIIELAVPASHPGRHTAYRYIVRIRE